MDKHKNDAYETLQTLERANEIAGNALNDITRHDLFKDVEDTSIAGLEMHLANINSTTITISISRFELAPISIVMLPRHKLVDLKRRVKQAFKAISTTTKIDWKRFWRTNTLAVLSSALTSHADMDAMDARRIMNVLDLEDTTRLDEAGIVDGCCMRFLPKRRKRKRDKPDADDDSSDVHALDAVNAKKLLNSDIHFNQSSIQSSYPQYQSSVQHQYSQNLQYSYLPSAQYQYPLNLPSAQYSYPPYHIPTQHLHLQDPSHNFIQNTPSHHYINHAHNQQVMQNYPPPNSKGL